MENNLKTEGSKVNDTSCQLDDPRFQNAGGEERGLGDSGEQTSQRSLEDRRHPR